MKFNHFFWPNREGNSVFMRQKQICSIYFLQDLTNILGAYYSYDSDTSFFEEYFNFPLDHTSTSEVHKNGENILQKGMKLEEMLILTYFN